MLEVYGDPDWRKMMGARWYHLLVRRNDKTGELAYYRWYSPTPPTVADYVRVVGWRWKVFQTSKEPAGWMSIRCVESAGPQSL